MGFSNVHHIFRGGLCAWQIPKPQRRRRKLRAMARLLLLILTAASAQVACPLGTQALVGRSALKMGRCWVNQQERLIKLKGSSVKLGKLGSVDWTVLSVVAIGHQYGSSYCGGENQGSESGNNPKHF